MVYKRNDYLLCNRLRLNALGVTLDFYGKSDRGSVLTKMSNVTPYYSVIILYSQLAKSNILR